MCGIAGIARAPRAPVERETLERMCEAQVHCGPDACGLHLDDGGTSEAPPNGHLTRCASTRRDDTCRKS